MNNQQLLNVDFFKALGLEDLSDEQKLGYIAKIQQLVLNEIINEDAPKYLGAEDLDYIISLEGQAQKMEEFLRLKIPNWDRLVEQYTLKFKEQLLNANQG